MYGLDADLIMLGLATHEPYFYILREIVYPPNPLTQLCNRCGLPGHRQNFCANSTKAEIHPITGAKPFLFLDVTILREYLEGELYFKENDVGFAFDLERVIDDWVFLCFFVGNDFLPHAPCLEIREGAIDFLTDIYKKKLRTLGGYITDSGKVDLKRAQIIAKELGEKESQVFQLRKKDNAQRERMTKLKKLHEWCAEQGLSYSEKMTQVRKFNRRMDMKQLKAQQTPQAKNKNLSGKDMIDASKSSMDPSMIITSEEGPLSNKDLVKFRHQSMDVSSLAQPILKREIKYISATSSSLKSTLSSPLKQEGSTSSPPLSEGVNENEKLELPNIKMEPEMHRNDHSVNIKSETKEMTRPSSESTLIQLSPTSTIHPKNASEKTIPTMFNTETSSSSSVLIVETPIEEIMSIDNEEVYPMTDLESIDQKAEKEAALVETMMMEGESPKTLNVEEQARDLEKETKKPDLNLLHLPTTQKRKHSELLEEATEIQVADGLEENEFSVTGSGETLKIRALDPTLLGSSFEEFKTISEQEPNPSDALDTLDSVETDLLIEPIEINEEAVSHVSEVLEESNVELLLDSQVENPPLQEDEILSGEEMIDELDEVDDDNEDEDDDNEDEEEEDPIRLSEEGGASRYYQQKFKDDSVALRQQVARAYLEGMCWVLHYYYLGCPSWKWFYPYHYAPLAVDFQSVDLIEVSFELGAPFRPFDQLMAVFPPASRQHIPSVFHSLMTSVDSEIIDFYPETFDVDLNGKKYAWQGVVLLPFIDETRLLNALNTKYPLLTPEESKLNNHGHDVLMISAINALYPTMCMLYGPESSVSDNSIPTGSSSTPSFSKSLVPSLFQMKLSLHLNEVSGFLGKDINVCPPGATFISPFPDHKDIVGDILNIKSLSAAYQPPPHPPSKFKSCLLPHIKLPPRKLTWYEIEQAYGYHRRSHPHILIESYGAHLDLVKPPGIPLHPEGSRFAGADGPGGHREYGMGGSGGYKRGYPYSLHASSSMGSHPRSHPAHSSGVSHSSHYGSANSSQHRLSYSSMPSASMGSTASSRSSSYRSNGNHPSRGMHRSYPNGPLPSSMSKSLPVRAGNNTWHSPTYQPPVPSSSLSSSSSSSSTSYRTFPSHPTFSNAPSSSTPLSSTSPLPPPTTMGSSRGHPHYHRGGHPRSSAHAQGPGYHRSEDVHPPIRSSTSHPYYGSETNEMRRHVGGSGGAGSSSSSSSGGPGGYPQGQPRGGGTFGHLAWSRNLIRGSGGTERGGAGGRSSGEY
ncbi:5'-3' exoribonuclease 2 [Coelomomyces lativittatus]|nr:5'-3' exoribonuclease 2 [Coelomomyces lativittatus]